MHVKWERDRCIVCLREDSPLSVEHVIPASIGGRLTSNLLCRNCNSNFGHQFDHEASNDPSIVMAFNQLKRRYPDIENLPFERYPVIVQSDGGTVRGTLIGEELRVRGQVAADGTLILPTNVGRANLKILLRKEGQPHEVIEHGLRMFDDAPDNQKIILSSSIEAVKWEVTHISLDLSRTKLMSDLAPMKIAYQFLALHVGGAIYENVRPLTDIRGALTSNTSTLPAFRVERLMAKEYRPVHGIFFESAHPHTTVLVRFPGWLSFRVHFENLHISGDRFIYTHDLVTRKESVELAST